MTICVGTMFSAHAHRSLWRHGKGWLSELFALSVGTPMKAIKYSHCCDQFRFHKWLVIQKVFPYHDATEHTVMVRNSTVMWPIPIGLIEINRLLITSLYVIYRPYSNQFKHFVIVALIFVFCVILSTVQKALYKRTPGTRLWLHHNLYNASLSLLSLLPKIQAVLIIKLSVLSQLQDYLPLCMRNGNWKSALGIYLPFINQAAAIV